MAGGRSDYLEYAQVNEPLGAVTFTAPSTVYVALYTASPTDAASGNEMSGSGYARASVTNNTTNWPAANPKSNGTAITFPAATADWARVYSWQILDASSGGNRLYYGPLATNIKTAYVSDTTNDVLSIPAHGWSNDTVLRAFAVSGSSMPGGLAEDTRYYVAQSTTDTLKLSSAAGGGSIVNLTTLGFCELGEDKSVVVSSGGAFSFTPGSLVIEEN